MTDTSWKAAFDAWWEANEERELQRKPFRIAADAYLAGRAAERVECVRKMQRPLCGIVSASGPLGEPLACALAPGHDGLHSWASLPTFLQAYVDD